MNPSLRLLDVGKRYRLPAEQSSRGWLAKLRSRPNDFWALRKIAFDLNAGESLGIIGHNGAGKSTLLKLLSGITSPTTGRMEITGRMAGLLEVGSGFHPELTGRENIFLSGTILGMRRSEIHRKLDSIIDFAEVRQFIDLPVKRYSSGMYVRLGFSIAAHIEPDILLLDEVLAVGDAAFQLKCLQHVKSLRDSGVTIVFISHDLRAVASLCSRTLLLHRGEIIYDGATDQAVAAYQGMRDAGRRQVRHSELDIEIRGVTLTNAAGEAVTQGTTGEFLRIAVDYEAKTALSGLTFELAFRGSDNYVKTAINSRRWPIDVRPGEGLARFVCDQLCLPPDVYQLDAVVEQVGMSEPLDWVTGCRTMPVQSADVMRGIFQQSYRFEG